MKSISFNQAKAKGSSLVELLLVLGVLAILLVTAFVVYPQVRDRNQANAEVSNLTAIKANIANLYASRGGNYSGLNTTIANQARAFPSSMNGGTFSGSNVTAAWGGEVDVGSAADPTAAVPAGAREFGIRYTNVPDGVCLGLVSGAASNFNQVTVGTAGVFTNATGDAALPANQGGQFNPGVAAGACTGTPDVTFVSN